MEDNLTVADLLKIIELYEKELANAVAAKNIAVALKTRLEQEVLVLKQELDTLKSETTSEGSDNNVIQ